MMIDGWQRLAAAMIKQAAAGALSMSLQPGVSGQRM